MKLLKVEIDYFEGKTVPEKNPNGAGLTQNYLQYAVDQKYKDGLEGSLRRQFGRIQRKLDTAVTEKKETVELEDGEFDLIFRAFGECKFPTSQSKYINLLEDELQKLKVE